MKPITSKQVKEAEFPHCSKRGHDYYLDDAVDGLLDRVVETLRDYESGLMQERLKRSRDGVGDGC
ncbi:hypothetical protein [Bifidobacterium aemilianum]|nr:hypothetical protein [Bifidobacterium aemilianum]